ncbi:hypothetical protein BGZ65_007440 [Modicella reniformis]|uniref:Pirin N-terminal domain-containing protein n=1 Tax=Modicella reniformis TaxID=1440133 RepID=A0A9P6LSC7_9FUNG|nr:hypothetical protein BGZ65_007440 [Modicella reniformis]
MATSTLTRTSRSIVKAVLSREQAEGAGARVRRSIGRPELRNHDPFLMLDEFDVDKNGGFPDHPHRGFETVTYMLEGQFQHEDFAGHKGTIGPGDFQWMTAGRGIVYSETPVKSQTRAPSSLALYASICSPDPCFSAASAPILTVRFPYDVCLFLEFLQISLL